MNTAIFISILGAISAISVSIIGAWLANRNNVILQTRKLKEEHYVGYIEALHNLVSDENKMAHIEKYVFVRDKLFLIAGEEVIRNMLLFENNGVGAEAPVHDKYLTELIKSIRIDLRIVDKNFPVIYFKKAGHTGSDVTVNRT